jgi:hypothetical protein
MGMVMVERKVSDNIIDWTLDKAPVAVRLILPVKNTAYNNVSLSVDFLNDKTDVSTDIKDPRLLPIVEKFFDDIRTKLDLEHQPLMRGSKEVPVEISVLNKNSSVMELKFGLPVNKPFQKSYQEQSTTLNARIIEAIDRSVDQLEMDSKAVLAKPVDPIDDESRNYIEEIIRKRHAPTGEIKELQERLMAELKQKHKLKPLDAMKIAATATKFMSDNGLLKPSVYETMRRS